MKILLAIDSSEASQNALREAASRPWPPGSQFEVLTVVEPAHLWATSVAAQEAGRRAGQLVHEAAEELRRHGLDATGSALLGDPKNVILDRACRMPADLVMVGSHGGALRRMLLGNVAAAVTRHAPCSVEIVRAGTGRVPARRLLLATDGSGFSKLAAESVASRPWPKDAEIRVLSVIEYVVPAAHALLEPPFLHSEQVEKAREDGMRHAQEAVASAVQILQPALPNLSESISVLLAAPRDVILNEAREWGADLIVLGSHGRSGIDRFLLGSVSEGVAAHADCSVEVIRKQVLG